MYKKLILTMEKTMSEETNAPVNDAVTVNVVTRVEEYLKPDMPNVDNGDYP